nr:hypothetical protein [Bacteroides sp.]
MTPEEILSIVEEYLPSAANTTLCKIEKGCRTVPQCHTGSTYSVLDFDSVKDKFCKGREPLSSVDALTINPDKSTLLLVEIKSWKKAAIHPITKKEADEESLKQTAEKFKCTLSKKIRNSFEILNELTGLPQAATDLNWAVIFVSDLDTEPLSQFLANMSVLAAFPTEISKKCNDLTNLMLGELPNVKTYHTGCHEFDYKIKLY